MDFDYGERRALLHDPVPGQLSPHSYLLCTLCAEKLTTPRGWELEDLRDKPQLFLAEEDPAAPDEALPAAPDEERDARIPMLETQRAFPQRG